MEDIIAVLGAVGSNKTSILGTSEGGNLAALFAATHVGSRITAGGNRRLLTVVFTDIAESTRTLQRVGDETWRQMLAAHDRAVRDYLARFEGEEVKQLGDGFLAVFEGPARAIRCSLGIVDA